MMERHEIEEMFPRAMQSAEASSMPEGWWDRATFQQRGILDLAVLAVNGDLSLEEAKRETFQAMLNAPPGLPVRILNAPIVAMESTIATINQRRPTQVFTILPNGDLHWRSDKGIEKTCFAVVLLIYKAEMGSPGFW